jgi:hypothetical protein
MSHRVLSPQQFFHGTDVDLSEATHVEPGHAGGEMSQFFGGNRGASRVYAATTAEGAARYGRNVYQVEPKRGARGLTDTDAAYMFGKEGHPHIQALSFKSPMRIVGKVEGASYSPVIPHQERLENLRWLRDQGHEIAPEGQEFLKQHGP